jgi:hypothetical protein
MHISLLFTISIPVNDLSVLKKLPFLYDYFAFLHCQNLFAKLIWLLYQPNPTWENAAEEFEYFLVVLSGFRLVAIASAQQFCGTVLQHLLL